jgi:hypothetical protein
VDLNLIIAESPSIGETLCYSKRSPKQLIKFVDSDMTKAKISNTPSFDFEEDSYRQKSMYDQY